MTLYDIVDRAALVLRDRLETDVGLCEPDLLKDETRSLVIRCRVDGQAVRAPASIIIKYFRDDTTLGYSDWASLQFLTELPTVHELTPRYLGGDVEGRLFLQEDLGEAKCLGDVLAEYDPKAAGAALRAVAQCMAHVQGACFGQEELFLMAREALPGAEAVGRHVEAERWLGHRDKMVRWLQATGCEAPDGLQHCLDEVSCVYAEPDPALLTFSHGDPAPSNNHIAEDRVRLLDFEYGTFRHVLYDLSAWSVLCPLPTAVLADMVQCFRGELGGTCPRMQDGNEFRQAWAALCIYRGFAMLTWISPDVLQQDRPWGDGGGWTCRRAVYAAMARVRDATASVARYRPVYETASRLVQALELRYGEFADAAAITPQWNAFSDA
jgi:hypothetical protein